MRKMGENKWTGTEVRRQFLDYFISKGHREVSSAPLIPQADPTLLFINAGMCQFKDVFTGAETREYKCATSSQKCLRVSGKHNDLGEVGRTSRHHTFFEMLGNFSFGDYFKEEAIVYGWEFLTEVCGLPGEKLYPTVFREDDEAAELWQKKIGLPLEKITRLDEKDNFWSMGETGPCGPCSEILFDQGKTIGCGKTDCGPACDCGRFLEVWNLVFMQYDRSIDGEMIPLPKPSIDTGMGLERLTAIIQGVPSNYLTDFLKPITIAAGQDLGVPFGKSEATDVSLRVVADHLRAISFLLADGITFGNEGRQFVMRRLARRALRHGKKLGCERPFLHKLVPLFGEMMGKQYPELLDRQEYIIQSIEREEEQFQRTLTSGLNVLDVMLDELPGGQTQLPGDKAFLLHDTYGFPLDLTATILAERGLTVDEEGFQQALDQQRTRSRSGISGEIKEEKLKFSSCSVMFDGYKISKEDVVVKQLLVDNQPAEKVGVGQVKLVIDPCPFYGEKGGQLGDQGKIFNDNCEVKITDARWHGEILYLIGEVISGEITVEDRVTPVVDMHRRRAIERNHSATHLLQQALRCVVGDHVKQAGSLVAPERLRFDYSHYEKLSQDQINQVEDFVNKSIWRNIPVEATIMSRDEAQQTGALAFFGDKYGQEVRVVEVAGVSQEFCGGCHVQRTGDIGVFKIISETSIAAGMRRIEAVTADGVVAVLRENEEELSEALQLSKMGGGTLPEKIKKYNEELRQQRQEIKKLKQSGGGDAALHGKFSQMTKIGDVDVYVQTVDGFKQNELVELTDDVVSGHRLAALVLFGTPPEEGKPGPLVIRLSKKLTEHGTARELLDRIKDKISATGGGRPDLVQGKSLKPDNIKSIATSISDWLCEIIKT